MHQYSSLFFHKESIMIFVESCQQIYLYIFNPNPLNVDIIWHDNKSCVTPLIFWINFIKIVPQLPNALKKSTNIIEFMN
jgi:hypothetical protein